MESVFKSEWSRIFVVVAFVLLLKVTNAFGGYVAEPYVGYLHGEYNSKHNSKKYQYDSLAFGTRAGYRYLGFDAGLDFTFSLSTMEQRMPVVSDPPKTDYFGWGVGPYIGYQFPILLRVWGGYFLHNSYSARTGNQDDSLSGRGPSLGVGYQLSFVPMVDVFANLELRKLTIHKVEDNSNSKIHHTENSLTEILLTISVPFEFNMDLSL